MTWFTDCLRYGAPRSTTIQFSSSPSRGHSQRSGQSDQPFERSPDHVDLGGVEEEETAMGGLILTRRPNEAVVIRPPNAPPVRMKVIGVEGNKVRFYFEADRSVQIDREEIDDRKQRDVKGGLNGNVP